MLAQFVLPLIAGFVTVVQSEINGRSLVSRGIGGTLINNALWFFVGCLFLGALFPGRNKMLSAFGGFDLASVVPGLLGAIFVSILAFSFSRASAVAVILTVVTGQTLCALLLELFYRNAVISVQQWVGMGFCLVGVALFNLKGV